MMGNGELLLHRHRVASFRGVTWFTLNGVDIANALPPFEELVEMTDVTTSSKRQVKFVLTEQSLMVLKNSRVK